MTIEKAGEIIAVALAIRAMMLRLAEDLRGELVLRFRIRNPVVIGPSPPKAPTVVANGLECLAP